MAWVYRPADSVNIDAHRVSVQGRRAIGAGVESRDNVGITPAQSESLAEPGSPLAVIYGLFRVPLNMIESAGLAENVDPSGEYAILETKTFYAAYRPLLDDQAFILYQLIANNEAIGYYVGDDLFEYDGIYDLRTYSGTVDQAVPDFFDDFNSIGKIAREEQVIQSFSSQDAGDLLQERVDYFENMGAPRPAYLRARTTAPAAPDEPDDPDPVVLDRPAYRGTATLGLHMDVSPWGREPSLEVVGAGIGSFQRPDGRLTNPGFVKETFVGFDDDYVEDPEDWISPPETGSIQYEDGPYPDPRSNYRYGYMMVNWLDTSQGWYKFDLLTGMMVDAKDINNFPPGHAEWNNLYLIGPSGRFYWRYGSEGRGIIEDTGRMWTVVYGENTSPFRDSLALIDLDTGNIEIESIYTFDGSAGFTDDNSTPKGVVWVPKGDGSYRFMYAAGQESKYIVADWTPGDSTFTLVRVISTAGNVGNKVQNSQMSPDPDAPGSFWATDSDTLDVWHYDFSSDAWAEVLTAGTDYTNDNVMSLSYRKPDGAAIGYLVVLVQTETSIRIFQTSDYAEVTTVATNLNTTPFRDDIAHRHAEVERTRVGLYSLTAGTDIIAELTLDANGEGTLVECEIENLDYFNLYGWGPHWEPNIGAFFFLEGDTDQPPYMFTCGASELSVTYCGQNTENLDDLVGKGSVRFYKGAEDSYESPVIVGDLAYALKTGSSPAVLIYELEDHRLQSNVPVTLTGPNRTYTGTFVDDFSVSDDGALMFATLDTATQAGPVVIDTTYGTILADAVDGVGENAGPCVIQKDGNKWVICVPYNANHNKAAFYLYTPGNDTLERLSDWINNIKTPDHSNRIVDKTNAFTAYPDVENRMFYVGGRFQINGGWFIGSVDANTGVASTRFRSDLAIPENEIHGIFAWEDKVVGVWDKNDPSFLVVGGSSSAARFDTITIDGSIVKGRYNLGFNDSRASDKFVVMTTANTRTAYVIKPDRLKRREDRNVYTTCQESKLEEAVFGSDYTSGSWHQKSGTLSLGKKSSASSARVWLEDVGSRTATIATTTTLGCLLSLIALRHRIANTQFDFTDLTMPVWGCQFLRGQLPALQSLIKDLAGASRFTVEDWLDIIRARSLPSVVGTLTPDWVFTKADIVLREGKPPIVATVEDMEELPAAIRVEFMNPALNIAQDVVEYRYPWATDNSAISYDLTWLTIDRYEAKLLAIKLAQDRLASRTVYKFELMPSEHLVAAGDLVEFPFGDATIVAIVGTSEEMRNGNQSVVCYGVVGDDSIDITVDVPSGGPGSPFATSTAEHVHLDFPLMANAENSAGDYLRKYAYSRSANDIILNQTRLDVSTDDVTYTRVEERVVWPPTAFLVNNPDFRGNDWGLDPDTEIWGQILAGDWSTVTNAASLGNNAEGHNVLAIGGPGRWHILHFGTIVGSSLSHVDVVLTDLFTGQRNSTEQINTHLPGDLMVVVSDLDILTRINWDTALLDATVYYKATPSHLSPLAIQPSTEILDGRAEQQPPLYGYLAAQETDGDIFLTAELRTRLVPTNWLQEAPADAIAGDFVLQIWNGTDVVREVMGLTDPEFIYTEAMQISDFGSAVEAGEVLTIGWHRQSLIGGTAVLDGQYHVEDVTVV